MVIPPSDVPLRKPADDVAVGVLDDVRAALGDDFEVLSVLGEGKVSIVLLAKDRALGVLCAIKVLRRRNAADETARRRFEREARAAASLADHPNTVAVTRYGRLPDETPYLVMQYVKGRTMEERLKAEGRLAVSDATTILREVASALALAHEKGILHRDVRPDNVMWDEENQRARLTDFGIAAVLSPEGLEATRLTKTGQLLGDPRYLSPEQLLDEELTAFADMYLFGVLGYELIAGRPPYDATTPTDWITSHVNKDPIPLAELRPDVPSELADLLRRCLAKEPRHRPSAKDVVRALETGGALTTPGSLAGGTNELHRLVKKRVPQIVLIAVASGWALMNLVDQLADRDVLPELAYRLTLPFAVAGVLAATVVGWFHGEKGRQKAPAVEYLLLGLIAIGWLVVSALVWSA